MSHGELEAQVLEAGRAQATAPPDTSSQLRLTSQAEADAWQQSADAEAEHDQVRAENARSLATTLAAQTSRLETANARYEEWSVRTASTREIAGKAKAELQRRGQEPETGSWAPGATPVPDQLTLNAVPSLSPGAATKPATKASLEVSSVKTWA